MKITLINLPAKRFRFTTLGVLPPLGLAYIASVLLRDRHKVGIIDVPAQGMSLRDFQRAIRNDKSDVYGISSTLFGFQDVIKFSAALKRENPTAFIVLGGLCAVLPADVILRNIPDIDVIVRGEGEIPMQKICSSLSGNGDLSKINGISFRRSGKVFSNAANEYMDLQSIPFPAYDILNIKRYYLHPPFGLYPPVISMETSRGCVFGCEFCCLSKNYRTRRIEDVVDEMVYLKESYNINEIYFVDHTFTISQEYVKGLCRRIIDKRLKIHWTCKTRVDCVSSETLRMMRAAGCYTISYGVESGSEKILRNINKGITPLDTENAIRLTRKHGIRSVAYMLVGSPGEDRDTIKESLDMIKKIKPDYVLYNALAPDPASGLYERSISEKAVSRDFFDNSIFFGTNTQWPVYTTSRFTRADVEYWVKKGTRDFYLNIFYMVRCLIRIRTLNEIKVILKGAATFFLDLISEKRKYTVKY